MRHPKWKFAGLALFIAFLGLRCAGPTKIPSVAKPAQVEVEGEGPLLVKVTDVWKRALRPEELTPPTKAGFIWDYKVRIANRSSTGISLDRLRLTVQNLWGQSWPGDQPLNVKVRVGDEEQISVHGRLASTDPNDLASLTGVETLTFLGRRDDGNPITFTVRVPLD